MAEAASIGVAQLDYGINDSHFHVESCNCGQHARQHSRGEVTAEKAMHLYQQRLTSRQHRGRGREGPRGGLVVGGGGGGAHASLQGKIWQLRLSLIWQLDGGGGEVGE